ncbi:hypothetical protein HDE_04987 [Halotydeus destructor]|nr:hypothetical protein HDE_04987 [Halotydeus destructor]
MFDKENSKPKSWNKLTKKCIKLYGDDPRYCSTMKYVKIKDGQPREIEKKILRNMPGLPASLEIHWKREMYRMNVLI